MISVSSVASPLVSIIIPAFNYERYVARAIESALVQDYPSVEVVVVDDGSTDGTAAVAKTFEARGVTVVSQENQGLAAARNTGIRHSKGDLLFFLDADDYLEPGAISRLSTELAKFSSDWGMVACQAKVLLKDGSLIIPDNGPKQAREVTWRELMFGTRFPCTVLIRREVLEVCGGFDAAYHRLGCEDRDMWLRVAERFRIWSLPERWVVVAFHGANMSSNPERQLAGIRRCLGKALRSGQINTWRIDFKAQVWSVYHSAASLLYEEKGQSSRQCWHAVWALILWPLPGVSAKVSRSTGYRLRRLAVAIRQMIRNVGRTPLR